MGEAIYKFDFDCGRMGNLYGLFVADEDAVKDLIVSKRAVYFGEVLGKHSEIIGPVEERDVTMISNNPDHVKLVKDLKMETGFNPIDY